MSDEAAEKSVWELIGQPPQKSFVWNGTEYPVRAATLEEQLQFCEWLAARALAAIESQSHLSPAALDAHRSKWSDKKAAGHWDIFSPAYFEAVVEPSSQAKLVSIVLTADGHPECTHEFVKRHLVREMETRLREVLAADPKLLAEAGEAVRRLIGGTAPPTSAPPSPAASGG